MVFIFHLLYICFNYSRNIFRDYQAACANIDAEMAFVDTNAEFEGIRQGVCNNETTNQMEIYVHLEKHDSGSSKNNVSLYPKLRVYHAHDYRNDHYKP